MILPCLFFIYLSYQSLLREKDIVNSIYGLVFSFLGLLIFVSCSLKLLLGSYTFRIIKSSHKVIHLKKCLTLFLAILIASKSNFSGINLVTWDLLLTYAKHIEIQNQFMLRFMRIILPFSKQSQLYLMSGFWALKSPLNCTFAAGPRRFHLSPLWVFHGQVWPQPSTGALWTLTPVCAL